MGCFGRRCSLCKACTCALWVFRSILAIQLQDIQQFRALWGLKPKNNELLVILEYLNGLQVK